MGSPAWVQIYENKLFFLKLYLLYFYTNYVYKYDQNKTQLQHLNQITTIMDGGDDRVIERLGIERVHEIQAE